ncbi:membrane protein [Parapedobacter pyrenivorans]|uniref:Membrane protein n=1 Tax=Parapedobacter pyrenivorans TaxID=1305674 RepID=A0A917MCG1_9SPHI|nr:DUF3307 domain-containing protein [Parapedobacter pyrenivorans]GGG95203.1 membrane protein [Parapedobacter pyrenivorans]
MTLFLTLLLAHIIGDFWFQPDSWVVDKQRHKHKSRRLYIHILIHAALLAVFLGFNVAYWVGFAVIVVSHYLIDLAKLYAEDSKHALYYFLVDQALHVAILGAVAHQYEPFSFLWADVVSTSNLLFATALAFVIFVPAVLIRMLIAQWRPETKDKQSGALFKDEESLIRAGRFIGILERLFVFLFIVIGHWEAVGFLLAAKSIFRFGDLRQGKDRKLTEYVLIGTLLSFGIAILIALAYLQLATTLK